MKLLFKDEVDFFCNLICSDITSLPVVLHALCIISSVFYISVNYVATG